jgi:hypothetical protein
LGNVAAEKVAKHLLLFGAEDRDEASPHQTKVTTACLDDLVAFLGQM